MANIVFPQFYLPQRERPDTTQRDLITRGVFDLVGTILAQGAGLYNQYAGRNLERELAEKRIKSAHELAQEGYTAAEKAANAAREERENADRIRAIRDLAVTALMRGLSSDVPEGQMPAQSSMQPSAIPVQKTESQPETKTAPMPAPVSTTPQIERPVSILGRMLTRPATNIAKLFGGLVPAGKKEPESAQSEQPAPQQPVTLGGRLTPREAAAEAARMAAEAQTVTPEKVYELFGRLPVPPSPAAITVQQMKAARERENLERRAQMERERSGVQAYIARLKAASAAAGKVLDKETAFNLFRDKMNSGELVQFGISPPSPYLSEQEKQEITDRYKENFNDFWRSIGGGKIPREYERTTRTETSGPAPELVKIPREDFQKLYEKAKAKDPSITEEQLKAKIVKSRPGSRVVIE